MLKKLAKKFLKKHNDRTKEYWIKSSTKSEEEVMEEICDNFDREAFESKKVGLIFSENIQLSSDMIVLDLACGMGRTCKWVAPNVKQYCGVDFIQEMITKAKKYNSKYDNAKFFVNDGKTLNIFENNTFHLVYSDLAFQHFLKPIQESYVKEVKRVLKNEGLFYVEIPRLEYYNDSSYARTRKETDELFRDFSIQHVKETDAYYYVKAKKIV